MKLILERWNRFVNEAWNELMKDAARSTSSGKAHSILKAIYKEPRGGENVALECPKTGRLLYTDRKKANGIKNQYAKIASSHGKRIPVEYADNPRVYTAQSRMRKNNLSKFIERTVS